MELSRERIIQDILKETDKTPIFIDLSNILYRSMFVFKPDKFKAPNGEPNGHLFGLCQLLRTCSKKGYIIFLCADSKCEWRQDLNENYKSNRDSSIRTVDFYGQYDIINGLLSDLPDSYFLFYENTEADDIIFSCSKICSNMKRENLILSSDKDLLQALDEYTTIVHKVMLNENEEIKYKSEEYYKLFPVEPSRLAYYRTFKGDKSDNIKPIIDRFPKDLMLDLIEWLSTNNKPLREYEVKKESHKKWIDKLEENWEQFNINYRLMKLGLVDFRIKYKAESGTYEKLCEEYGLYQYWSYINSLKIKHNNL